MGEEKQDEHFGIGGNARQAHCRQCQALPN